ncbi:MAG: hypothetical protein IPN42_17415 [Methylococcaceae bacterium]|nr:hypothetical protein [Methylococcaceae bacterium]
MDFIQPGAVIGQGERIVSQPIVVDDGVLFSTVIPLSIPCQTGGSGWLMAIQDNGARFPGSPIDFNNDNEMSDSDKVTSAGGSETAGSGFKSKDGILFKPSVIEGNKLKRVYVPGSELAGDDASGTSVFGACMKVEGCGPPGPPGGGLSRRVSWRQIR